MQPGHDFATALRRLSAGEDETPPVAVCIPLYDKERFVFECIQSVLDQTFTGFELVIQDNASQDGSLRIARSFDDPRIRVLESAETIPATANFNRAVAATRAPFVKVLPADDLLQPDCLARQWAVLSADPGLAMVSARHHVVDGDGAVVARDRTLRHQDLLGRQDRSAVLRRVVRHGGNPIGNPGNVLFRRRAFAAAGGFPEHEEFFSVDVSLWLRLLEHGDFVGIPQTLCRFRIEAGTDTLALGREAARIQRRFIVDLCHSNRSVVRRRDVVYGELRRPLTTARHRMLSAAGGPENSTTRRFATRLLALARKAPDPRVPLKALPRDRCESS
jgi:glycosyltransferase involved in cell wall biosynthesis